MELLIPLLWIFLAVVIGLWANRNGRNGMLAATLALLISPPLIWLLYLAIGPKHVAPQSNAYEGPIPTALGESQSPAVMKNCRQCWDLVPQDAVTCRHCGQSC